MPHWQEGMLLKPQHLQSLSRYLENRDGAFFDASHPFYWGVKELKISPDEVANEVISIRSAVVSMRDGLLIRIPQQASPPARNFKKALDEAGGELNVFLAVPQRQSNVPVVGSDTTSRYQVIQSECEDENIGSNSVTVDYRSLNTRLLFSNENAQGYETIAIAKLRYSSEQGEAPELDPGFAPPCVDINSVDILKNILNDAVHLIDGKSRDLATQLVSRRVSFGEDSENLLKLHAANSNLTSLRQISSMRGVHPLTAYMHLSRLIGELSIFTEERKCPDIELYDHENPAGCLDQLLSMIRGIWSGPDTRYFETSDFRKADEGRITDLEDSWLDQELDLFLGVESPVEIEEVNKLMQANIRMGELGDMGNFKKYNVIGVARTYVKNAPPELPQTESLHYFKIERRGHFWDSVKSKRNLTLGYLGESEELILNKLKTDESNLFKLYIVLSSGR